MFQLAIASNLLFIYIFAVIVFLLLFGAIRYKYHREPYSRTELLKGFGIALLLSLLFTILLPRPTVLFDVRYDIYISILLFPYVVMAMILVIGKK